MLFEIMKPIVNRMWLPPKESKSHLSVFLLVALSRCLGAYGTSHDV